jgi:hypothetical protein
MHELAHLIRAGHVIGAGFRFRNRMHGFVVRRVLA